MKKLITLLTFLTFTFIAFSQSITAVTPNSGQRGTVALPITISGSGTHFNNATFTTGSYSLIRFRQGSDLLTVNNVSSVTDEQINLSINISNSSNLGNYFVEVYDSFINSFISLQNGFTVTSNTTPPTITNTTPEIATANQILPITITASNTNFAQATDNVIYLTHGNTTLLPINGTTVVLNNNNIRAKFDLSSLNLSNGSILNSHCGNSFDGVFTDPNSITIENSTSINNGIVSYTGSFDGIVELYQKNNSNNTFSLVANKTVTNNNFSFNNIPNANYLIRAVPVGTNDVVATYYPNNIDWADATLISPYSNPQSSYTITPVQTLLLAGGVTVNGAVGYGPNGFVKAFSIVIAEGIEVFLKDVNNNTFAQTTTNSQGEYSFNSVPLGSYSIVINIPGFNQVSTYDITVSNTSSDYSDLDFLIDNNEIFKTTLLSIEDKNNEMVSIYPNPSNNLFNISIPESFGVYKLTVYDQLGHKVISFENQSNRMVKTDLSDFSNGIYFITIKNENSIFESKLIKF